MIRLLAAFVLLFAGALPAAARDNPLAIGAHILKVGGVKLWYRVAGPARGVPLVFVHGGPGEGSQAFQAVGGPELEKTRRIVYLDQRGSGRSDRPKDAKFYTIPLLVDDIEALRRHLGMPRIALIGHSFGTILALEYASYYSSRTAAVVLAGAVPDFPALLDIQCRRLATADPAAYARATAGLAANAYPSCNAFGAYSGSAMKDHVYASMFPDPATGARVDALDNADGLGNSGEMSRALFAADLLHYRFLHPRQVTAPVLIIAGGKDLQAAIEPQRGLAEALPRATLLEYPENGHFMLVEAPDRFARDVSAFLKRVGVSK